MNTRTIFYAGTGYTQDGEVIDSQSLTMALAVIRALLAREYGGFTEIDAVGGWEDATTVITSDGRERRQPQVITESAKRFEAMDGFDKAGWTLPQAIHKGREVAQRIAEILNQASVLFAVEEMHAEFTERVTA